ncbi:ComF family protein [Herbaspirillum sp. SJZ107]|uniref:ComF family protein n=1 Tax=Herbaspirillum sp. SJZ107 TaxID=2572881 RepID=UPI001150A265|nr:ComF family protein [Herbaspirillum sp. SJZ107]
MRLRRLPMAVVRRLLPSTCALCGDGCDGVVCPPCCAQFAPPRGPCCARCANPLPVSPPPRKREPVASVQGQDVENSLATEPVCGSCLADPPAFDATVAAVDYAAPLDQLVLQLKFGARLPLAPWFAERLRDAVLARPAMALPDVLCPVPLGRRRLVERGFNQALEIARPLAASLGVALHPKLAERTTETTAQSGVTPAERAGNVRGAFAAADPDRIAGRHVGLVDDVMTSGHTLAELAATFKRFGAARVTNFVFARTPPHF